MSDISDIMEAFADYAEARAGARTHCIYGGSEELRFAYIEEMDRAQERANALLKAYVRAVLAEAAKGGSDVE